MSELAKAMLLAQMNMPAVEKNATNPFYNSMYTTCDYLLAKALPIYRANRLLISQWPTHIEGKPALRTRIEHVDSGEFIEDEMLLAYEKPGPQEQGSCLTYAKRYALSAALCISTEDDDDANAASVVPAVKATTPAPPSPRPSASGEAAGATDPQRKKILAMRDELLAADHVSADEADKLTESAFDDGLSRQKARDIITALEKRGGNQ